jgi:hypothetical protein
MHLGVVVFSKWVYNFYAPLCSVDDSYVPMQAINIDRQEDMY